MESIKNKSQIMIDLQYMVEVLEKTWIHAFTIKFISSSLIVITAFFLPIKPFIALTCILVTMDFVAGIAASKYPKDKTKIQVIESGKVKRSVFKLLMYGLSIIVWHSISYVLFPAVQLAYFATAYIAITEATSFDEKYEKIFGYSLYDKLKEKVKIK